jgi:ceramide glucosyltransferase
VRGVDPEAYSNFASFCEQDYPDYEILFATGDATDPAIPIIKSLIEAFPQQPIRVLIGSGYADSNDKVSNLCRLAAAAQHEILVVTDSDICVGRDYLRAVVKAFADPRVGAATCLYSARPERSIGSALEAIGLTTDFCAGVIVAWLLQKIEFTMGATMAVTRKSLASIGGFEALTDYHADDFELGKRIRSHGWRAVLLPCKVTTILPLQTVQAFLKRRLRWAIGVHNSSPASHLGLLFTHGLIWSLAAASLHPSAGGAMAFIAAYLALRSAMAWAVGIQVMQDPLVKQKWWLIPLWDVFAFATWVASFAIRRIHWRGADFYVRRGRLVSAGSRNGP